MSEPTKQDVIDIAVYLGCNGEELWNEMSKLLRQQDMYARRDEEINTLKWVLNQLTFTDGEIDQKYIEDRLSDEKEEPQE